VSVKIINSRAAEGRPEGGVRRITLYADPVFARLGGLWRPIDEIIRVRRDGQVYVVTAGDEWIRVAPAPASEALLAAAWRSDRLGAYRWGPRLDAATVAGKTLDWRIAHSGGVTRTGDAWQFGNVSGTRLGLAFRDWRRRLGSDCVIDGRAAVAQIRFPADAAGEIDLDPETTLEDPDYQTFQNDYSGWADCRSGDAGSVTLPVGIEAVATKEGDYKIERACIRFDTSAYGDATEAHFRIDGDTYLGGGSTMAFGFGDGEFPQPLVKQPWGLTYIAALDMALGNAGDHDERITEPDDGVFTSSDLVGAGGFSATTTFDVAIIDKARDYDNIAPAEGTPSGWTFETDGATGPRLVITTPPAGGDMLLTGVG
jgi:hypothetical protein